ncbi:MAG: GNAT family N-acetyltransferase [Pyrinomonadaceae bacterium]
MFSHRVNENLELRLLEDRHAAELYALVDRDRGYLRQWMPWLDGSKTVGDIRDFIGLSRKRYAENSGLHLSVVFQNRIAGQLSLHNTDWPNRKTEIGYWLGDEFQGKGLMTEACRALISYAFQELELNRVEIRCATENGKSRAIPERLNFTKEGIAREAQWLYDHYVNLVVYAMLAKQWRHAVGS